jgi:hypothetical protein
MMIDVEKMILAKRKNFEESIVRLREKVAKYTLAHARVRTLGLSGAVAEISEYNATCGLTVEIQREELPMLREVFGRPEIAGKDIRDASKGTINVFVTFEALADTGIRFSYIKVLSAEQKCRIKTVHSSYETLVCENGS